MDRDMVHVISVLILLAYATITAVYLSWTVDNFRLCLKTKKDTLIYKYENGRPVLKWIGILTTSCLGGSLPAIIFLIDKFFESQGVV